MNTENYEVVRNINLLRNMAEQGFIKLHPQTGTKIKGLFSHDKFTCYYIDEAPSTFEFRGRIFGEKYFSGCFYPYLVEYK